jgi:hypothetical protein
MRRIYYFSTLLVAIIAVSMLIVPFRSQAITYGYADTQNIYSNTGAFIVKAPSGEIYPICSGTLITSNVFLTASHCTEFYTSSLAPLGYTAYVSFDKSIPFGDKTTTKTKLLAVSYVVTNPNYSQSQSDTGDIGVLILRSNVKGITPATLPTCGLFDQLAAQDLLDDAIFTNAGYGLQNRVVGGGVPYFQDVNPIPRMYSFSSFNALNNTFIRLSQNPSTGNGGTCFGDSGGPNFLTVNGQQILGSITITGDAVCRSTNTAYRLDTPSAQNFLKYVNATYGTSIPTTC